MKFQTLQEVRDWRNSAQIECLLCHKKFHRITNTHVAMHGLTQNEYRALFGIPWSYSLTSAKSREAIARSNKNTPFLPPAGMAIQPMRAPGSRSSPPSGIIGSTTSIPSDPKTPFAGPMDATRRKRHEPVYPI